MARELTLPGSPALAEIVATFGEGMLDARGALDRAALAAVVFADPEALARLNRIVHPRVRAAEAGWAAVYRNQADAVLVTDGALLVESGVQLRFDRLVVVHCLPELQLRRLRERDGLGERAARARIEAQLSSTEKRAFAHFEIDTSGTPDDTDHAAAGLAATLASLAGADNCHEPATALPRFVSGLAHGPEDGPRGLSPDLLLAEAAVRGGLEMEALAQRLVPPARAPWYRAAQETKASAPPCRLGVALAAWAYQRRGNDPDFAAMAMASVARLVDADPGARTDACLVALVALERAADADRESAKLASAARWLSLAERFGGGAPSGRLEAVWTALGRFPEEPVAARDLCARLGGDAPTAAALAGLRAEASGSPRAQALRHALELLGTPALP